MAWTIQWTEAAKKGLAKLPKKVRRGLLDKARELGDVADPTTVHKPLTGPLQGYSRICYSRYRAIFTVERKQILIRFVAAGVRKEGDKNDIYRLATKLIKLGVIPPAESI